MKIFVACVAQSFAPALAQIYNFAFKEILTLRHCEIPLVESWRALRKASHPL
ncbi:hypothetical protein [Helicobacter sp.]|uniref:hypothetical protein n=1 Tax=Helicobacter sp. TaxID=218 RepID=UPI002A9113AD|nr:hypothetical protein [Helicobacter sp.]MDY5556638.1 hypothetical protein [Helicobacter sp.]